jgi:hypothetical protein
LAGAGEDKKGNVIDGLVAYSPRDILHDMGMLVTRDEFDARSRSGFPEFCENVLKAGDGGKDYLAKVEALARDDRERFLYQEFVRHNHATRVKNWVLGVPDPSLGIAGATLALIDGLLSHLGDGARYDLGLVCESHHLDDLDDTGKYSLDRAYGNSDAESANLQYVSVLLRSADLLQITNDRTPSVIFKLINPTDPISLEEWAKQRAVNKVTWKPGLNQEGQPDEAAPRDTVAIHARFQRAEGFFGLTSYLDYTARQLRQSCEWIEASKKRMTQGRQYDFPWRYVDDSAIQTEGFIRKIFHFALDERRILDLLTGHTLYNDADVVIRELAQNAIDAVRLQFLESETAKTEGRVEISWDSTGRVLTVQDNGTGMTQDIIEKHLLTVGSSRYRDPKFVEKYPKFSAISRFGIGVLTAFMVADQVEIVTSHPDEPDARLISLRTVHGRYLIKLLKKRLDPEANGVGPHGTIVRLWLRRSANVGNVLATAQKWLIVPGCTVTVKTDDSPAVIVGYATPKDALHAALARAGFMFDGDEAVGSGQRLKVVEEQREGVQIAYVLEWIEYFREWQFYVARRYSRYEAESEIPLREAIGMCVEGVRVRFGSPGYRNVAIVGLANCTGSSAPRTNVARSELDRSPELTTAIGSIYNLYCEHIRREFSRLQTQEAFSITWSVGECRYITSPLRGAVDREDVEEPDLLARELLNLPLAVVEAEGQRSARTLTELREAPDFWTIHSALFHNAEYLLREVASSLSLADLARITGAIGLALPSGPVMTGLSSEDVLFQGAFEDFEVASIRIDQTNRRVDLQWRPAAADPIWLGLTPTERRKLLRSSSVPQRVLDFMESRSNTFIARHDGVHQVLFQIGDIQLEGAGGFTAVKVDGTLYILRSERSEELLRPFYVDRTGSYAMACMLLPVIFSGIYSLSNRQHESLKDDIADILTHAGSVNTIEDIHVLMDYLRTNPQVIFDPSRWQRKSED